MSEQRVSQPQLAGDPSANKSKPTVASLFIAIFGALANVAALVTLAVQRQYLALLITFGVSIALVADCYMTSWFKHITNRRLVLVFGLLLIVTAGTAFAIGWAATVSLPVRQSPPSHAQVEIFQPGMDATMEGGTDVSVTGTIEPATSTATLPPAAPQPDYARSPCTTLAAPAPRFWWISTSIRGS